MANVQHKDLPNAQLHEPKGVSASATRKAYIADGAGSGAWCYTYTHGSVYFVDLTTPSVITTPTAYTKAAPTTTASASPIEYTEASTARLTYTGTLSRHTYVHACLTVDQTAGASRILNFAIYKNGLILPSSECQVTLATADKFNVKLFADVVAVTNDYFEVYAKTSGTGNIQVYSFNLAAASYL